MQIPMNFTFSNRFSIDTIYFPTKYSSTFVKKRKKKNPRPSEIKANIHHWKHFKL